MTRVREMYNSYYVLDISVFESINIDSLIHIHLFLSAKTDCNRGE